MEDITFIAPAHNELRYDRPLVESLLNQDSDRWKLIICHNGRNDEMRRWIDSYNDPRLNYLESKIDTGNYGTYNRIKVLENFLDTKYVIQTSIQDYYLSWTVKLIIESMEQEQYDMCYWNSINHLTGYDILDTELKMSRIDWGNFCLLSSIAKKLSIPKPTEYCADWFTLEKGLSENLINKITKIPHVLTIHN